MTADDAAGFSATAVESEGTFRVDCYVRSVVPEPIAETIDTLIERLERLCEDDGITDFRVSQWPVERYGSTDTDSMAVSTRDELITEFDCWADQHGYTLEPAFRREIVPASSLGLGTGDSRERVRVPLIALALYKEEADSETLRGVVPYTDCSQSGKKRTYTVEEWLTAFELEAGSEVPPI